MVSITLIEEKPHPGARNTIAHLIYGSDSQKVGSIAQKMSWLERNAIYLHMNQSS